MKEILLKTEKLSKSFSHGGTMQHVLKNIDLTLYKGDFTVIMGASGAGKSTLLYALSGMDTPSLGTITFGNEVISALSPDQLAVFRRRACGFVFQQIYLIDGMSLTDNVLSAGLLVNKDKNLSSGAPGSCSMLWGFLRTHRRNSRHRFPAAKHSVPVSSAHSSILRKSCLPMNRQARSIQRPDWTSLTH